MCQRNVLERKNETICMKCKSTSWREARGLMRELEGFDLNICSLTDLKFPENLAPNLNSLILRLKFITSQCTKDIEEYIEPKNLGSIYPPCTSGSDHFP